MNKLNKVTTPVRFVAAGAMALTMAGCGGNNNAAAPAPAETPAYQEPATLPAEVPQGSGGLDADCTVETPCEISFRWWGGDDRQRRTLEAIEIFQQKHPEVHVQAMPVSLDGYYDQLLVEFAAGNPPDVFQLDASRPREFGPQGLLLPLDGLLNTTHLPAGQIDEASYGGTIYAAPHTGNANALIVNTDLFEEAGVPLPDFNTWSWDDFEATAAQLRENLPADSYVLDLIPINIGRTWIAQRVNGGFFTDDCGVNAPVEVVADWFAWMKELVDNGTIPPAAETAALQLVSAPESMFGQGRAAFMFAPSSTISQMVNASGNNMVLAGIPGESTEPYRGVVVDVGIYYGVSANTTHPLAAAKFVDFMVNDVDAGMVLGTDRGLPLNSEVSAALSADADQVAQEQFRYIENVLNYGSQANPRTPGGWFNADVNRNFEGVIFGSVTPEAAAQQLIADSQDSINGACGR